MGTSVRLPRCKSLDEPPSPPERFFEFDEPSKHAQGSVRDTARLARDDLEQADETLDRVRDVVTVEANLARMISNRHSAGSGKSGRSHSGKSGRSGLA
jgi:hypothetical protein